MITDGALDITSERSFCYPQPVRNPDTLPCYNSAMPHKDKHYWEQHSHTQQRQIAELKAELKQCQKDARYRKKYDALFKKWQRLLLDKAREYDDVANARYRLKYKLLLKNWQQLLVKQVQTEDYIISIETIIKAQRAHIVRLEKYLAQAKK